MLNTSGQKFLQVGLRGSSLAFVTIALGLVVGGGGVCYHKPFVAGIRCFAGDLSLLNWHRYPLSIMGQYFVTAFSLVTFFTTIVAIVFEIAHQPKHRAVVMGMAIVNVALSLANAFLEAWYASTWLSAHVDHPFFGRAAYNQCWVAATAFYVAAAILFIIDLIIEAAPACVNYEDRRSPQRPSIP